MKALTLTTASKLKPGDQFYRSKDSTKQVYQVSDKGSLLKYQILAAKLGLRCPDIISKKEEVIFLKHSN